MSLIFDKSISGRRGVTQPETDVPVTDQLPERFQRSTALRLCELSELDVVRHFTELSRKNYGVDTNFYPLGSCTMKYNPKICEKLAQTSQFASLHPFLPQLKNCSHLAQGSLAVLYELEQLLAEICGMDAFTLQPLAGAHGELTAMLVIKAYHQSKGHSHKTEVLIPDEAHGTNPASAAMAGFTIRSVPTNMETGTVCIETLEKLVNENTAALMVTNPNTLGIFNPSIDTVAKILHKVDAQLYYDGANLNAVLGKFRPGDANFDAVHVNLHKTFATPHGGGGPGAGPVGVKKHLTPFLPVPRVSRLADNSYQLTSNFPQSIGHIAPFYGNFGICFRAYVYIKMLGAEGLRSVSENAVLNANYVLHSLKSHYHVPVMKTCMHECVFSAKNQLEKGVHALDIAKALIDYGIHPPTIYFPLIVKEAIMVEPTETESKETLDRFIDAMVAIAQKVETDPESLHNTPITTPVSRMDETKAVKSMDFAYEPR